MTLPANDVDEDMAPLLEESIRQARAKTLFRLETLARDYATRHHDNVLRGAGPMDRLSSAEKLITAYESLIVALRGSK